VITYPFVLPALFTYFIFIFILPYKIKSFQLRPPLVNTFIILLIISVYIYVEVLPEDSIFNQYFSGYNTNLSIKNIAGTFLSFDAAHLVGNLIFLYIFGNIISSDISYKFYFLLLLFSTVIIAGIDTGRGVYSVGISGFVCSLAGACMVLFPTRKIKFFYSLIIINGTFELRLVWFVLAMIIADVFGVLNFVIGRGYGDVNYQAHLMGFVIGAILAHVCLRDNLIRPKIAGIRLVDFLVKNIELAYTKTITPANRHIIFCFIVMLLVQLVFVSYELINNFLFYNKLGEPWFSRVWVSIWNLHVEQFILTLLLISAWYKRFNIVLVFGVLLSLKIIVNLFTYRLLQFGTLEALTILFFLQATRNVKLDLFSLPIRFASRVWNGK